MTPKKPDDKANAKAKLIEHMLIEHMLSEVEYDLQNRRRHNDFIESIREQFDTSNSLSEKQIEALRRFYANV